MELYRMTALELSSLIRKGEVSPSSLVEAVAKRIEEVEEKLSSYVTLTIDEALSEAKRVEERLTKGEELGPLAGIPIAVKDVICTKGIRTTCSSRMLENFVPPYDATVVRKLKEAGAIIIGKTNMDEFAMGSSTENSAFFPTRNPWDTSRVPGGSSGGSAAAVSAGETILALGSDTGGSIRQPAALCGIVGVKPTYGRVSRYGLVAFASSLDQIGPMTRTVADSALLLSVIAGYDPADSTSVDRPVPDYLSALEGDIKGMKVGIPKEYFGEGLDPEVEDKVREAISLLSTLGVEFSEVSLPHTEYAIPVYYLVATAEASSNLARYDGVRYGFRMKGDFSLREMYIETRGMGFGAEVKRRIMLGTYALSAGYYDAYYLKAQKVRSLIKEDFDKAFSEVDLIITPTSPTPAFKLGERVADPLKMYLSDIFTVTTNLAGITGISLPCGFTKENLPVGLQILAPPFSEELMLRLAHRYEQEAGYYKRMPPI